MNEGSNVFGGDMRIQPGDMIAGYSALAMRKLMQRGREFGPTTSGNSLTTIAEILEVDLPTTRQIYQALCTEGYIEPVLEQHPLYKTDHWFTTIKGNALANASARKPITRKTADQQVEQLLNRVKQVNTGDYAYRVKRVILFGSYLSDLPTLGDVDISLELEDRYQNVNARKIGHEARVAAAESEGRHFRDFLARLMWPRQEVLLLLKNRSPSLSLHDEWREQVLARQIPSRILFESVSSTGFDNEQIQGQK